MRRKSCSGAYILLPLFILLVNQGCTSMLCTFSGYSHREIKETCVTDEPGTYLDPRCNFLARRAADYRYDPDSVFTSNKLLVRMVTKKIRVVEDEEIPVEGGRINLRIYCDVPRKSRVDLPTVVYYHGGGFQHGSIEVFDYFCRKIARSADVIIVAVEYRLAPEYIFPTEVNDSYAGLLWVHDSIKSYGGDPENLFLMGGSAGGNLAAVIALVSHDRNGPVINGQILCYPATTFEETEYPSRQYFATNDGKYVLTRNFLMKCKALYLGEEGSSLDPYASPLLGDLHTGMPRALVITAQCDPLRDEGRAYAEKMADNGIDVTYLEYEGMIHAFIPLYPLIPQGREAIKRITSFILAAN